jgi:hypothetical protein
MVIPSKCAHAALRELVGESDGEPLALRVNQALKKLRPLRSMPQFDAVIAGWMNDACDTNSLSRERAKIVIETIFYLWPPTDDLKPRARL